MFHFGFFVLLFLVVKDYLQLIKRGKISFVDWKIVMVNNVMMLSNVKLNNSFSLNISIEFSMSLSGWLSIKDISIKNYQFSLI